MMPLLALIVTALLVLVLLVLDIAAQVRGMRKDQQEHNQWHRKTFGQ